MNSRHFLFPLSHSGAHAYITHKYYSQFLHPETASVYSLWRLIMHFMGHLQTQTKDAAVSFFTPEGLVWGHKPLLLPAQACTCAKLYQSTAASHLVFNRFCCSSRDIRITNQNPGLVHLEYLSQPGHGCPEAQPKHMIHSVSNNCS